MKCCDLSAGKLIHGLRIERNTVTNDGLGGHVVVAHKFASCKALVKPVSGAERVFAQRIEASVTHRIFIRYISGLLPSDTIIFKQRPMQIRAIINLEERNRWLEIHAEEGVAT